MVALPMTKLAIRSVKSLHREDDERELYKHEIAAIDELINLGLGEFTLRDGGPDKCFGLSKKGKSFARHAEKGDVQAGEGVGKS